MDHVRIQNRISHCAVRRDIAGLNDLKKDITVEKERLDRWFNKSCSGTLSDISLVAMWQCRSMSYFVVNCSSNWTVSRL